MKDEEKEAAKNDSERLMKDEEKEAARRWEGQCLCEIVLQTESF
jgi:hypothetical protein